MGDYDVQKVGGRGRRCALFSSIEQGEQRTGLYRSDSFEPAESLSFYVAGHDGLPDKPLKQANFVRLRDTATGEILKEASPPRNDVAHEVQWETAEFRGRSVFVELVDGDSGAAYAWLAVGRFSDQRLNPSDSQLQRIQAASLIGDFTIDELRPALIRLIGNPDQPRATRALFAAAILKLRSDSRLAAVALVPLIAGVTDAIINDAMLVVANNQPDVTGTILESVFQVATSPEQLTLAEQLAADAIGADMLLRSWNREKHRLAYSSDPPFNNALKPLVPTKLNNAQNR